MKAAVRSELLKVWTLPTWRWFVLGAVVCVLVAASWTAWQMSMFLQPFEDYLAASILRPREELSAETVTEMQRNYAAFADPEVMFGLVFTAGKYAGLLLAALFASTLFTAEVRHRTLGATFLTLPRRGSVVAAKFVVAAIAGAALWAVTTLANSVVAVVFAAVTTADFSFPMSAVAINLAAYLIWSVLGLSVATFFQNPTVAAVVIAVGYVASSTGVQAFFELVHQFVYPADWLYQLQVLVPGTASALMTAADRQMPGLPDPWVGAVVLLSYAALAAVCGAMLLRRKEV